MYTVFSRAGCTFCDKAKELLSQKFIQYNELVLDKDVSREYVLRRFPESKVLPIVLDAEGKLIGGYTELIDHLNPTEL